MKKALGIIATAITLLNMAVISSCDKDVPPPSPPSSKEFIVEAKISTIFKEPCDIGYGYDTVISFLNFIPKDSLFTINSIKVKTYNSTVFPDSFLILKGFTWLDYKIVASPPSNIVGVKLIIEPNGTVTCRLTDIVYNDLNNPRYNDTIRTVFELGKYDDIVNLKGYTKKEISKNMKIHLPSLNDLGKNNLSLKYDTLGVDSGVMIGEIFLARSTPDSAIARLVIGYNFKNVCGNSYSINFAQNGDYTLIPPSGGSCIGLFKISSLIRNGNNYKVRFNRTLDGALAPLYNVTITGYGRCNKNTPIIERKYNY
jgi:hypothetical protein